MTNPSKQLTVTAVIHQNSGIITAFFNELPALVVQGNSNDDVKDKLRLLLKSYIKRLNSLTNNIDIRTQSLV